MRKKDERILDFKALKTICEYCFIFEKRSDKGKTLFLFDWIYGFRNIATFLFPLIHLFRVL